MKKTKPVVFAMVVIMLMQTLVSCKSAKKDNVVKEDDPWYESTRFELDMDIPENNELGRYQTFVSGDKIYSVYSVSPDRWGTSRTLLDTYDFDGNRVSRKEVKCSDGFRVQDVYAVSASADGTVINALAFLNSADRRGDAFIKIDPQTGEVTEKKDFLSKEVKDAAGAGTGLFMATAIGDYMITLLSGEYHGGTNYNWVLLLFKNNELVTSFDLSSITFTGFYAGYSINEATNSMYMASIDNGELMTAEFDLNNGSLKDKKSTADPEGGMIDLAEYSSTSDGDMCKIDTYGNIYKLDVTDMTPKLIVDTNWYTPYFYNSNSDDPAAPGIAILSCNEERTVIWEVGSKSYCDERFEHYEYIRVIRKADKNPHAGKQIIELALPIDTGISTYLTEAISAFNKTDEDYVIRVWDKHKNGNSLGMMVVNREENETAVYEMIQDLKGDDAPDLAIGIQKNYAMRDDVFMDLSDFLDQEVLDKQYANIIEAGRIDGKLYFLPVTLEIEGLVTNKKLVKDGASGITFEEYDRMIKSQLDGFSPYDHPLSTDYNKRSFILSCIDTKSAIEGGTVDFGTDQFRTAIAYAKDNFGYDDEKSTPREYVNDIDHRERTECYYARINDYLEFVRACYSSENDYVIIGTPSVDASGPRFRALETISVSATTDVEEGCRRFINFLFSGSAYSSSDCEFELIVTNKEIMSRNIEFLTSANNDEYDYYVANKKSGVIIPNPRYEIAQGNKYATDAMRASFLDSMATISTYYYEDPQIVKLLFEETGPYYTGDHSMDTLVDLLNDRVTKYIREM